MYLWDLVDDIRSFNTINDERKQEIIDIMMTKRAPRTYGYTSIFHELIKYLNDNIALKMFRNFIINGGYYMPDTERAYPIIKNVYNRGGIKKDVKDIIRVSKNIKALRTLLLLDDITVKDEELGLRALSGMKNAPDILFVNKYKPSVEAMKNLPPVIRLNVMESLLSNHNISYNVFENFTDQDEFKSLLFGSVLRHNDRANVVWKKYNEVQNRSIQSTTMVEGDCENCGKYTISIKSTRMGTLDGLNSTRIGRSLKNSNCALCEKWGQPEKQIIL